MAQKAGVKESNIIVTTDVGQHQMWSAQYYPVEKPRQFLTSGSLGTMGFGLPAAIGASLANKTKRVVCISGDGSNSSTSSVSEQYKIGLGCPAFAMVIVHDPSSFSFIFSKRPVR